MHDCLFRNRDTAEWIAYGDFDEYMVVPFAASLSLSAFLSRYASQRPWVSYGSYIFARYCDGHSTPWGRVLGGKGERTQARRRLQERSAEGQVRESGGGGRQGQGSGNSDQAGGELGGGHAAGAQPDMVQGLGRQNGTREVELRIDAVGAGAGSVEGGEKRFAVELMVLRQRDPYCVRSKRNPNPDLCLSVAGRRKFIVNPRKVRSHLCS